jgi:hypothetical protein
MGHMSDEFERIWKEATLASSGYYHIYLEGLKKTTQHLSYEDRCRGRNSKRTSNYRMQI